MKESMGKAGYTQGDMSPKVKDYAMKEADYSQRGFSKTDEYIERQDRIQGAMSKGVDKQAYKGRYS